MVGLGTAFLEKFFKSLKKFLRILVCLELIKYYHFKQDKVLNYKHINNYHLYQFHKNIL